MLNPCKNKIDIDPDTLNDHYHTTANRILKSTASTTEQLHEHVNNLYHEANGDKLTFHHVTYEQVFTELKSLRMDCSAGYDNIGVSYIKPVLEFLASPLTHIINAGITENIFHSQWKIGKITTIPKVDHAIYIA